MATLLVHVSSNGLTLKCGAAIFDRNYVITAADCVHNVDRHNIELLFGKVATVYEMYNYGDYDDYLDYQNYNETEDYESAEYYHTITLTV